MFIYSEVPQQSQTELYTDSCQDYVKVLQTYEDNEDRCPIAPPWTPSPCLLIRKFQQFAERIRDFVVHPTDIWIITYPKSGTTWTQEMVWLLANDLDYVTAKSVDINKRSPFFELSSIGSNLHFDSLEVASKSPKSSIAGNNPRVIKTHLPVNLLPDGIFREHPKLIYVTRNAKDTAISYFHHYRMLLGYRGTLDTFLEAFLAGDLIYGAQNRHVDEFVRLSQQQRDKQNNILVLRYEDMKRSMRNDVLKRTAKFLRTRITDPELDALADHLSFEQMRQNNACNNETMSRNGMDRNGQGGECETFHFLRKGQIGTYVDEMPTHFVEKFDAAEALLSDDLKAFWSAE